jgi:hypothetical protein
MKLFGILFGLLTRNVSRCHSSHDTIISGHINGQLKYFYECGTCEVPHEIIRKLWNSKKEEVKK